MAINTLLDRHARYRPDHLALVFQDDRLTWRQLSERVDRLINRLGEEGLGQGDAMALILNNSIEMVELLLAAAKAGYVAVPLSPLLRGQGLVNLVNDSGASALVTMPSMVGHIDEVRDSLDVPADRFFLTNATADGYQPYPDTVSGPVPAVAPSPVDDHDVYNIIYSSGTTGEPKGIVHDHRVRTAYGTGWANTFRIHRESILLHSGSLVFNGAFLTLVPSWYTGCTYVLLPAYQPDLVLETMAAEGVTHTIMVPSQLIELMQHEEFSLEHLPAVEMIGSVGAPLHLEHKIALERRFPGRIVEIYGLTEGFGTVLDAHDFHNKTESVGVPPPLFEMRIVGDDGADLGPGEVGEIVGRSPLLMPGYHNRPQQTAEVIRDGWLHSGDLGYVDDDGYLYLVDRKKDVIISGGVNVYPRDIEEIMVQHPAVKDVVVFGAPDDRWGEAPVAAVTLTASLGAETLRDWVNDRLEARFQKLREVIIRDSFPLSTAGKIIRREVKAQYSDQWP